jgi:hypothetical protein
LTLRNLNHDHIRWINYYPTLFPEGGTYYRRVTYPVGLKSSTRRRKDLSTGMNFIKDAVVIHSSMKTSAKDMMIKHCYTLFDKELGITLGAIASFFGIIS